MFALHSNRLRRRLSAPTSGSARRRARERWEAEQNRFHGERLARERREQKAWEKFENQHRAHRDLATYAPWGRGGGGAPNPRGIRFTNIKEDEIFPENELKGVQLRDLHTGWSTSPQHRYRRRQTPLRLREDPQIYYADNLKRSVDNDIRYRRTPKEHQNYKKALDDLVEQRYRAVQAEIKRNLEDQRQLDAMDGPWGKPGPGGTSWRNPRDIGLNFNKSMGWTDNEVLNKYQRRHKGSSLTLPKVKRDDDSFEEDLNNKENKPVNPGKLPEIAPTSGSARPGSNRNEEIAAKITNPVNYPVRGKRSPKKTTFVPRLTDGEENRLVYPQDLYEPVPQCEYTCKGDKEVIPQENMLRLTGGVELVPLLARRRRVGARTLPSSDVTRPPEQNCQWREMLNGEYLRVLNNQIKVKNQQKEESRIDSAESVRRHHTTWASLWGRPGHGAPQQRGRYARSNLAQLLYVKPLREYEAKF